MAPSERLTDEEVAAYAAKIDMPVPTEALAALAIGVRRNQAMADICRGLVDGDVTPDFVFRPLRRAAKGT